MWVPKRRISNGGPQTESLSWADEFFKFLQVVPLQKTRQLEIRFGESERKTKSGRARPPGAPHQPDGLAQLWDFYTHPLIRLHDLTHKNVQLSIVVFAHFGDFVRPHFIPAYHRALGWRSVPARKFHNDARR